MDRSLILETGLRTVFPTVLLFSIYLLAAGHDAPGGGFIGGLVAGSAFVLAYVARGSEELARITPVPPEAMMGTGLVLATGTGVGAWLVGREFLESGYLVLELPLYGTFELGSVLVFDVGVYLTVVGLVLVMLRNLGREET